MFESSAQSTATGRYRVEIVTGEMRAKSHERKVQEALDKGSVEDWRLVNATTTNASSIYVTALYWDTAPKR